MTIYQGKEAKKEEAPREHFEPKPVPKAPKKEKPQPVKEEPKAEPVVEQPKPVEEKKPEPKPVKEAPKKAEPKVEPKKQEKQPAQERKKIPGKFIVKTNDGYYVSKGNYSVNKEDAKIFDDFNLANDVKKEKGGKVVKL